MLWPSQIIDQRVRKYLEPDETWRLVDCLMAFECLVYYAIGEVYLDFVLPAFGLVSNKPCPWAAYLSRGMVFVGGPLTYMLGYVFLCGSIHIAYTRIWPELGAELSIQKKPMADPEMRKAIMFSLKSIISVCGISNLFHYAMQGWTNVRWSAPTLIDIPAFIVAYFLMEISAYSVHRFLHRPWWYARVHKVHHYWKNPNVFVVSAIHPVELLAQGLATTLILITLPLSFPMFVLALAWIYIGNTIDHSGYNLEHWPLCRMLFWQASPDFHDNHHLYFHANFGALVDWWDRLGGTFYNPKQHGDIGLGEDQFGKVREVNARHGATTTHAETNGVNGKKHE